MRDYTLSPEARGRLIEKIRAGQMGEETVFFDNAFPDSVHLHLRRVGKERDGLAGRLALNGHGPLGRVTVYLSAPEARMLAAQILDVADELDGATPLQFFPPSAPEAEEPGS